MASWMIHFRVARALLDREILGPDPERALVDAFVLGNIAPDSGVPSVDAHGHTVYIPDKDTSHFMRPFEGVPEGENPERCDPHGFAARYLSAPPDPEAAAFYLGYLCHLVTDNAWVREVVYPAKVRLGHLRRENGVETPAAIARFYAVLKKDWYDMDFIYIKHHPELPVYRGFLGAPPYGNRFLPFFPPDAFEKKRAEIEAFYRRGAEGVVERVTYPTEEELAAFIEAVAAEVLSDFPALCGGMPAPLPVG